MQHTPRPVQANRNFVVVHGGARDSYQVAVALAERGMLRALVTDLFITPGRLAHLRRWIPSSVAQLLEARNAVELRAAQVKLCPASGLLATLLERFRQAPFAWKRAARRYSDHRIGAKAGRLARRKQAPLLAYSYFASAAFRAYGRPALLFQVHPHPLTIRRILMEELERHPECATSLQQEWELALPPSDLAALVEESQSAEAYLVASSFTRQSLIEHGVAAGRIRVLPYGVDLQHFRPAVPRKAVASAGDATLHLLFVGRINQRKGLAYLLAALQLLRDVPVHLTICGRVVDDLSLFAPFQDRVTIRPSVSEEELVRAYQQADLFVFPSVAEGFGQVLLESLACGLPILSTTHTAAPDLIEDGVQGWIVEPRRPDQIAARIRWAAEHRDVLRQMSGEARNRAEQFTWTRFRDGVVAFAQQHSAPSQQPDRARQAVVVPA